nr:ABC-F family ATP-binding cassette domain-containing protein [Propionicimonas sp.]
MSATTPSIVFNQASFAWPDGSPVLDTVTTAFSPGRTGLVGDNGAGKTTVLRLIAGELTPTAGSVTAIGEVGHLPQHITLATDAAVADLLGVRVRLDALRAIESGATAPDLFEAVGADWDVEARSTAALGAIGVPHLDLDRPVGTLSGGETMLVALAGLRLAGSPVVLLDEPTNNLDRSARERLHDAITAWRGMLVVVSHDVELLDRMDATAELHRGRLGIHGGGHTAFAGARAQEQTAVAQALRTAERDLQKEERQRREAETKLARRVRYANTDYLNKRRPKSIMNNRRSQAQVSAGKLRGNLDDRVEAARVEVAEQEARVREDERVRITPPDPAVPAGRRIAELHHAAGVHAIVGPERVALTGRNGVGKTLLLDTLFDEGLRGRRATFAVPLTRAIGYLPQRIDGLDEERSAVDNVRTSAATTPPGEVRAQLARFLIRGEDAARPVATLSGGERFRVALARLLLADPPHQLLVLDEPTNNLDLRTTQALADGLSGYRGALLIVSHDQHLLDQLAIDVTLELDDAGVLNARG